MVSGRLPTPRSRCRWVTVSGAYILCRMAWRLASPTRAVLGGKGGPLPTDRRRSWEDERNMSRLGGDCRRGLSIGKCASGRVRRCMAGRLFLCEGCGALTLAVVPKRQTGRESKSTGGRFQTRRPQTRGVPRRGLLDRGQQIPTNAPAASTSSTASPKPPPKD